MQAQYKLLEAATGEEALKLYWQHCPDLLLLDAVMPGIDGFEVCARLRAQDTTTPVLMITRLDDETSVDRAFEAGADDFITKPIHKAVLRHRVASIVQAYQLQRRITHLAYHDALTNLPNRQLLIDRLSTALARAKRSQRKLGLLFIDLDNFKTINDTMGHAQGDALLRIIAQRLVECVRESDTIARLGGDEFIILLNDIQTSEDASLVAEKLLAVISKPVRLQDHDIQISGSTGIAIYPGDGSDPGTLLRNADIAMYQAKELGRHRFRFYANEMSEQALRRMLLVSTIRKALHEEQFLLHYQPRFDLRTSELKGVEALVRWQHPELGMLYPDEFIPLAQDLGVMPKLGLWVLRELCQQAIIWQSQGWPQLRAACNLSSKELAHPQLRQGLVDVLRETGFDSHYLDIEINDDISNFDEPKARETLQHLHTLGIQFIMNDFNDGRAPLRYLASLPLSALKINRLFIKEIPHNQPDAMILKVIASVAQNLSLRMLADGVESEAQHCLLREIGCHEAQGYFYAKPSLAAELNLNQRIILNH